MYWVKDTKRTNRFSFLELKILVVDVTQVGTTRLNGRIKGFLEIHIEVIN